MTELTTPEEKYTIITAPQAVREHLAGEAREVVEYAATQAYYHYDCLMPGPRGKAPTEITREEWRLRYAVSQYETALARAKHARNELDRAVNRAEQDPPTGRWESCYLSGRQAEYVRREGGNANVAGHGRVRERDGFECWRTYSAQQQQAIMENRAATVVERQGELAAAELKSESLLTPAISAWIAARDCRLSDIRKEVSQLSACCAKIEDDNKHREYCRVAAASYARDYKTDDRSQWSDCIRGWMTEMESRRMTPEKRMEMRATAKAIFARLRDMEATLDAKCTSETASRPQSSPARRGLIEVRTRIAQSIPSFALPRRAVF
jgi:hypothetical protein